MKGRFIFINLKRMSVFAIIISCVAILFFIEAKLDNKIKSSILVHNDIDNLANFAAATNTVTYSLPKTYSSSVDDYSSGNVIHNNQFKSEDGSIFGFVQVVKSEIDLKEDIKGKDLLSKKSINNSYSIESMEINNLESMVVSYEFASDSKNKFLATEYFIKINEGYVKFSFFTPSKDFSGKSEAVFRAIVNTLKVQ